MKTILLAVNSKYIHTLLAPRYLKANAKDCDMEIYETNANVLYTDVLTALYLKKPDILGISCYIFNIEFVRKILAEIRKFLPQVVIILGGYEAVFDAERYLPFVDYILKGEGDFAFGELVRQIERGQAPKQPLIEAGVVCDLNKIVSPYDEEYCSLGKEKILYYESSRGCPFKCSYCMSSNSHGVRTMTMQRIRSDLTNIMSYSPKQIKFVDRTFNFNVQRANEILSFIMENFTGKGTNFHFEMAPELFSEELFATVEKAEKGLFQFEIGIQSYNERALKEVGRCNNIPVIEQNIRRIMGMKNILVHTDLIAGLPEENLESFIEGFDKLLSLRPSVMQLGFLKVLKGSPLSKGDFGTVTYSAPPYEVISTKDLSFDDIIQLKKVESVLELYYNSGRFYHSVNFMLDEFKSSYTMFLRLAEFYETNGVTHISLSAKRQSDLLFDFAKEQRIQSLDELEKAINLDYALSGNVRAWRRNITKKGEQNHEKNG